MKQPYSLYLAAIIAGLLLTGNHASAQTDTWTGATNGTWDTTTANWNSSTPGVDTFTNYDAVIFNGASPTTITIASGVTVGPGQDSNNTQSLDVTSGSYTFNGQLDFTGNYQGTGNNHDVGINTSVGASATFNNLVDYVGSGTMYVNLNGFSGNAGTVTFADGLDVGGQGGHSLVLASGLIDITGGSVSAGGVNDFGQKATINFSGSSQANVGSWVVQNSNVTLSGSAQFNTNGNGTGNNGALIVGDAGQGQQSGGTFTVNSGTSLTQSNGGTLYISGGTFSNNGGTVTTGGIQLDHTSTLNLTGGTTYIGSAGITSTSADTVNLSGGTVGATASWSSASNMTLTNTTTIQTGDSNGNSFGISLNGVLSGAGGLKVSASGTGNVALTLGATNTYTGNTEVEGNAQVTLTVNTALAALSSLTLDLATGTQVFDGTANLNYSGLDSIAELVVDGVNLGPGIYGSPDAVAASGDPNAIVVADLTGSGLLDVGGAVVPEPGTWALLLGGIGLLVFVRRLLHGQSA